MCVFLWNSRLRGTFKPIRSVQGLLKLLKVVLKRQKSVTKSRVAEKHTRQEQYQDCSTQLRDLHARISHQSYLTWWRKPL